MQPINDHLRNMKDIIKDDVVHFSNGSIAKVTDVPKCDECYCLQFGSVTMYYHKNGDFHCYGGYMADCFDGFTIIGYSRNI